MKSICIKNVKTLENTGIISLSPITLLVGKNSSGKSTFLRTFPLIKQSIRKSTDGPLLWAGDVDDYVDFGSFSETVTNGNSHKTIEFQFNFSLDLRRNNYYLPSLQDTLKKNNKIHEVNYIISINQVGSKEYISCLSIRFCQTEFTFKFNPNPNEIEVFVNDVKMGIQKNSLRNKVIISPFNNGYRSIFGFQLPPIGVFLNGFSKSSSVIDAGNINLALENFGLNEFFLPFTGRELAMQIVGECLCKNVPLQAFNRDKNDSGKKNDREIADNIFQIIEILQKSSNEQNVNFLKLAYLYGCFSIMDGYIDTYFRQVHYIAPLRATAERYYRLRNLSIDEVDYQGKNLSIFLDGLRRNDQLKAFNQWTDNLLGFHVQTKNDSGHLSIHVAERGKNKSTNLSDTGFGFSQILPIVTQLWKMSTKEKTTNLKSRWNVPFVLAIEQPELHLHPTLQASLAEAFIYLCGDIESLKFLSNKLSYPANNIYNALLQRHVESGSVMKLVKKVFILTMNVEMCINTLPDILKPIKKHHIIFLEHAIKMKWNLNERCCLLAENLDDCVFYKLVAQYYFSSQNFTIRFHCENGGGTTTSNVLEKCVSNEKVPTLCIVDSDQKYGSTKKYPQKPANGDTLKKIEYTVNKLENSDDNPPYELFPLEVHEIENLIPICILEKLKTSYPTLKYGLEILMNLKKFDNGTPILYYDLKKGFPYIKGEPKREYWKKIMLRLGGTESDMPPDDKPKDENIISSKPFFPPLSCNAGLLRQANQLIERYVKSGKNFYIDNHIEYYWKRIGEIVLTWGCTSVPMYT